jgi:hypothetical protein
MKTYLTIVLLVFSTVLFAGLLPVSPNGTIVGYDNTKAPSLSLPAAYDCAMSALGSSEGEWYFTFYPTNSAAVPKLIAVEFNGKVIFDHGAH